MIESGGFVGEVPPGSYSLESFTERLQFWKKNQVTVILTRCEETIFDLELSNIPSAEGVGGSLAIQWSIQLADPIPFLDNLFGARDAISRDELEQQLTPLVTQGVFSACGRTSIDQLAGPEAAPLLTAALSSGLSVRLQRYGLKFIDVMSARMNCPVLARQTERAGENWLAARENQLMLAAGQIENDELKNRLKEFQEKVPVRRALRDAVHADKFAKVESAEGFRKQLEAIDKDRLLRQEEKETLVAAYVARKEDHESAREHVLAVLEIDRERELEELRTQIEFAVEQKALEREIELANLTHAKDASRWQRELEREREEATHRQQLRQAKRQAQWRDALEARELKRDDSWKMLVHQQRMENLQTEIAVSQADRSRRVAILEVETRSRLADEQLQVDQRRQAWELDVRDKKSASQLDRLAKLQELNVQFSERQRRTQVELDNLKDDGAHRREVERIQAMAGLGAEALIATAKIDNASLLLDLKKHEANQSASRSQSELAQAQQFNDERRRAYEQLNETERAKADAIADAYKLALQAQQGTVQQMIGGLTQAAAPQTVALPVPHSATAPAATPVSTAWYAAFNGQQSGPYTPEQLRGYASAGQFPNSTLVWRQGLAAWTPAGQVAELAGMWASPAAPPPLPPTFG